jgi:hypothetical protein
MKRIYHYLDHPRELEEACPHSVEGLRGHILLLGCAPITTKLCFVFLPSVCSCSSQFLHYDIVLLLHSSHAQSSHDFRLLASQFLLSLSLDTFLWCFASLLQSIHFFVKVLVLTLLSYDNYQRNLIIQLLLPCRKASSNTAFIETLRRKHVELKVDWLQHSLPRIEKNSHTLLDNSKHVSRNAKHVSL